MSDYRDELTTPEAEYEEFHPNLTPPTLIDAGFEDGRITAEVAVAELGRRVKGGEVILLKDVFDASDLLAARDSLFEWSQETAETGGARTETDGSVHRRWRNETAPLLHRHFHLVFDGSCPPAVRNALVPFCRALLTLQNELAGTELALDPEAERTVKPSVFQYPSGGGYSPMHTHPYRPQRIGLILGLARRGEDYERGGTRFAVNRGSHGIVDTQLWHDIGDVVLFRTDLPHEVMPVDPTRTIDWTSDSGRWTLVLPYFHGE